MIRKLSSVYVLAHSGFVSRNPECAKLILDSKLDSGLKINCELSYGRLTIDFGIVVFAKTRWLFSYGVTFLPDARGDMLFYSVC